MEKQITINPNSIIPEKKTTKKNSKEHINSILEKYNLKAPKNTQHNQAVNNTNKTNKTIKTINTQLPQKKLSIPVKQVPIPVKQVPIPVTQTPIHIPVTQTPVHVPVKQLPIPVKQTPVPIPVKQTPIPIPVKQTIVTPNISINDLLKKDINEKQKQKISMPKAIISKNHPKDFNSTNIYNIIPKVKSKQNIQENFNNNVKYTHTNHNNNNHNHNHNK